MSTRIIIFGGSSRSKGFKLRKRCKQNLQKGARIDFIFCLQLYHIEYKNLLVFAGSQGRSGYEKLVNNDLKKEVWTDLVCKRHMLSTRALLHFMEAICHLGATGKSVKTVSSMSQEGKLVGMLFLVCS